MMSMMRTTVDLPDDIHRLVLALARSRSQTLSQAIADVLRLTLIPDRATGIERDPGTGLPTVRLGRPVTSDDVAALDDK